MNSKDILYSRGKNDECYTLDYGVAPILQYIPKDAVIWCPFDREDSEFVKQITAHGNKVIFSHIGYGQDFYQYEPDGDWDIIISNPPFTGKRGIFDRALSFNKPFALLCSATWLNDAAPVQLFTKHRKNMQLLMFDNRMRFCNNGDVQGKITFKSIYMCCDFLPQQIVLEHLEVPK